MTIKSEERAARAAERAARAEEQAAKAEEAAEAARLAEEAAAKAREAARLAQIAADEAAAVEADSEADEADETDGAPDEDAPEAATSLEKPRRGAKASEDASGGDDAAEDGSEASEAASVETEAPEDAETEPGESGEGDTDDEAKADDKTKADDKAEVEDQDDEAKADEGDEDVKPAKVKRLSLRKSAESTTDDDDKPRGRFRSGGLSTVITVLAVLTIALGAGTTALVFKVREQNATEQASKEASYAASRAAQKLSSYDYQTLDADLKSASATTTGKLHTQYDKLAQELRTVAVQQQAVSNTTVMKVGVVSATPDKVVALVYANRSSATKNDKQQRLPEPLRIKMTMVKKDGRWLASALTVLS
ncbi:hypothetical protein [Spirillospora sp. CA-128828]|uniref:hypothetical protein n=1 Tax=Spirillospora sp. CA-128828 TaxID=3240033 RepID=UPI003D932B6B